MKFYIVSLLVVAVYGNPARQLGEECEEDAQCRVFEKNASCEENFCVCDPGFYLLLDNNTSLCNPEESVDEKNCIDPPEEGPCRENHLMWYYDQWHGFCRKFLYGGCEGNGNKYSSLKECLQYCGAVEAKNCIDRPEDGRCSGKYPMWYYDQRTGICQKFLYGGCGGTGNKFSSEEECLQFCGAEQQKNCYEDRYGGPCRGLSFNWYFDKERGTCREFLYFGCQGNGNRYETRIKCIANCGDIEIQANCTAPPDEGRCKGLLFRWYYQHERRRCQPFIYGGCQGNGNRYESEEECLNSCRKEQEWSG